MKEPNIPASADNKLSKCFPFGAPRLTDADERNRAEYQRIKKPAVVEFKYLKKTYSFDFDLYCRIQDGTTTKEDRAFLRKEHREAMRIGELTMWRDLDGKLRPRSELPPGPTFYRRPDGTIHERSR